MCIRDRSFTLHKGEVLGFSGLVGAGRTEIMRAIIGADPMRSGEVYLEGKKIDNRSPKEAMENGIVLVPEDRKLQGILSNLSVEEMCIRDRGRTDRYSYPVSYGYRYDSAQ